MDKELKVTITADTGAFQRGMKEASSQLGDFKESGGAANSEVDKAIKNLGSNLVTAAKVGAAAVAAAGASLFAFASSTASAADTVDKMSQKLGLSREAYQQLDYVLSQSGTDINSFGAGMKTLLAQMDGVASGSADAAARFDALGVSVVDANGKMRSQEAVLKDTIIAFQNMENGAEKSRLAQELFGRSGQELLPLLNSQAGSFEELTEKASALGLVMGDEAVDAGVTFTDTLDTMKRGLAAIKNTIGAEVMPVVTEAMHAVIDHLPEIKAAVSAVANTVKDAFKFASEHKEVLIAIASALGIVAAAIGLYNTVAAVKAAMDALQATSLVGLIAAEWAQVAAQAAVLAPYVAIVAAIAAVVAIIVLLVKHWDEIKETAINVANKVKETVQGMLDKIKEIFESIKNAIAQKLEAAKEIVMAVFDMIKSRIEEKLNFVKSIVQAVIDWIKDGFSFKGLVNIVETVFNGIKDSIKNKLDTAANFVKSIIDKIKSFFNFSWELPKLKLPHISITGGFSLAPPKVPSFSIDWYAQGGVFDKPTVFNSSAGLAGIGEAGAEAVVPLEKNTEWLDKIAERLGGNGREIVIELDGRELGRATIDSINGITRQTGKLALVVG